MGKVFFKGLNELRAVAAFAVILHHIELFKFRDKLPSLINTDLSYLVNHLGKNGVYLFFVLSGFLITYLLLAEKENKGGISLFKFYLRRIFRIWPLYYLILIISFLVIPALASNFDIFELIPNYFNKIATEHNYSGKSFLLYFMFLPNLALYFNYVVVGCTQTWSVGVEEQFYIFWPLLIILFNRKLVPLVFAAVLIAMSSFAMFFTPDIIPFEYMAIGAIGGYSLFYYSEAITHFADSKTYLYFILIGIILVLIAVPIVDEYLQSLLLAMMIIFFIIYTVVSDSKVLFLSPVFSYLGTISYGIYMYHPFVMFLVFPFANKYFAGSHILYNLFVYIFIFGLTILLSIVSYKFFELRFIHYKDKKFNTLG
ncbi:acyltransferase family protein [Flavobacterium sp.]